MDSGPDLTEILGAIRERPDDGHWWLALAAWLWARGRDDEAAAVQMFWPNLRGSVLASGVSVRATLRIVARRARLFGQRAREVERPAGGWRW